MTSFKLIQNASYATISDAWKNESYTLLSIQVGDTFATADIRVEGRILPNGDWKELVAFDESSMGFITMPITSPSVYSISIESIAEIRIRVVSVTGGSVNIDGFFYDEADNKRIPTPASISQSVSAMFDVNSNLIVKGVPETFYIDYSNGNIVGYEHKGTEATVNISTNYQRIEGGFFNRLIGILPDSTRIDGTYTDQAFSLEGKTLAFNQQEMYGATTPMCEVDVATENKLHVSKTPSPRYGATYPQCYIRKVGEAWSGTAYEIDPSTKEVLGFSATNGEEYEIQYFVANASAKEITVPTIFSPKVYTVQIRFGVYAMKGASKGRGSLVGWLYFIVPRAVFTVDDTMSGSNTSNTTTTRNWKAISGDEVSVGLTDDCPCKKAPLGYYVYVPCDPTSGIRNIIVIGNGLSVRANQNALPPVKLVMKDDSLIQPDFTALSYMSEDESVATVSPTGYIKGVSEGVTYINVYVPKSTGEPLVARCKVTVTSSVQRISLNRSHIQGL